MRKAIELQPITGIADIERIMQAFYSQFPEEFNNVKIKFIEFNEPAKGGSYTSGYSKHNKEIAFNNAAFGCAPSTLTSVIKAFEQIRKGKKMSLAQHREINSIVHELLHQKAAKHFTLKAHYSGDYKRTAMETMNELGARATHIRFLRRMGANSLGAENILRAGNGYQDWVKRLFGFMVKAGLAPTSVGESFAKILVTESYDTMDMQLYNFFKTNAKKNFTQNMDEVLKAFESGKKWSALLSKWF